LNWQASCRGIITIDTLAQTLGGAEENGAGMQQIIANAQALSNHFQCFVLIIHHSGLSDDDRPRGHSSLKGALDVLIRFERKEGTLTIIGKDDEGEEISTLVVETIHKSEVTKTAGTTKAVPRSQRLLMTVIKEAIEEVGFVFRPFPNGPMVTGVKAAAVRTQLYIKISEKAGPDDDPTKVAERQRKAFNRAVEAEIKAKAILSCEYNGERILWLP
jgi:hypothetical protein